MSCQVFVRVNTDDVMLSDGKPALGMRMCGELTKEVVNKVECCEEHIKDVKEQNKPL